MEREMSDWKGKPNPGCDRALDMGCTCAVLDNNRGLRAPMPPDQWWITVGCPVHNPSDEEVVRAAVDRAIEQYGDVFERLKDS
jgi:hypothetical protein